MKRDVLLTALFGMIFVPAVTLRMAELGNRPMHTDEAVQAVKFGQLLEQGRYVYDPREYHGPSLNYLTLAVAAAASQSELTQISEPQLRLVPAVFGLCLIALLWLIRDGLGRPAVLWAAAADGPFARHGVLQPLLHPRDAARLLQLRRDGRADPSRILGRVGWPASGLVRTRRVASPGRLAHHARFVSGYDACHQRDVCGPDVCARRSRVACDAEPERNRMAPDRACRRSRRVDRCDRFGPALLVAALQPRGIVDSATTYAHYLGRAAGQGSAGSHAYPWYHYFHLLFWWRVDSGPIWTELPVGLLALVGLAAAALARGLTPGTLWPVRFLAVYTLTTAAVYSALPYKTPWSMLGFYHATILLAGVGAAVLVRAAPGKMLKVATVAVLAAAVAHLGWQAWSATLVAYDDPGNPYVYAHTTRDVPLLAQQIRQIAACGGSGKEATVHVICPNHDYWPLPWYFRSLPRVGWFDRIPTNALAPVIITRPELEPALVEHLYVEQPPGRRSLYVPLPPQQRPKGQDWLLRPNVPLRAYVRLDVWDTYRRAQREPDAAWQTSRAMIAPTSRWPGKPEPSCR